MPAPNQPPQQGPVHGKPILSNYPTPNLADRIFVVHVDSRKADYKVPTPGDKPGEFDPDNKLKDFVFATARPSDQIGFVDHFYVNERLNQDDYNYSIEYPWVSENYPRVIRTYVTMREKYAAPTQSDVDPKFSGLALVEQKVSRSDDPIIDSVFIAIQKVYEKLSAPTEFVLAREDAVLPYAMRNLVPARTVQEFQEGAAVEANANVSVNEEDWHVEAHTISAFKRMIMRIKRIIPDGGAILTRSRKWTKDQQIATVTQTWKEGNQSITPHAKLLDASVDDIGNNTTILEEVEIPSVFPDAEFAVEIPDPVPPEFRSLVPTTTEAETSEGTASMPTLLTGELQRTEHQLTEYWMRASVTKRALASLPVTLLDGETSEAFGFGGVMEVEKTLAATSLAVNEGIGVVDSKVRNLGQGLRLRETTALKGSQPYLKLTAGGSGYTAAPVVSFAGGTGSGAAATAYIGKAVASISITNGGSGYKWAPAVKISGGQGGGAVGVAKIGYGLVSITLLNKGSGYTSAPTVNITGDGSGATASAIRGYSVASIAVTAGGSGYSDPPTVLIGGDGSGASAYAVLGYGVGNVVITNGGDGYTSNPTVVFGGDGTGAVGTAVRGYKVASIAVNDGGSGYTSDPEVHFSDGTASATVTRSFGVGSVTVTEGGEEYTSPPTVIFDGDGTGAAGDAVLGFGIDSVIIDNGGSGYTTPPLVSFDNGDGGGATGISVLGFAVDSIAVYDGGSGYTAIPDIDLTGGDGSGATAGALMGLDGATVDDGGTGYAVDDILSIVGGTGTVVAQLRVTAETGGVIDTVDVETVGNYSVLPTDPVSVTGGTGAGAEFTTTWKVVAITLTAPGSGYLDAPNVEFSDGSASATATLETAGSVVAVEVISQGSEYSTDFTVDFFSGGGTGATGTSVLTTEGIVIRVDITNAGSGYTEAPEVSFDDDGGGEDAEATASLEAAGVIESIEITDGGYGYTVAPDITFSGGGGTDAEATATLATSGSIIGVTISNAGSGYTGIVPISFTGGGGLGAAAYGTLASTGSVKSIVVTAAGDGFTSAPAVTMAGGATATATLSSTAKIKGFTVTNAGTGYTTIAATVSGGGGSGATGKAVLAQTGAVKSVLITHAGSGFRSVPDVTFAGGLGSGAAGTVVLATSGSVVEVLLTADGLYTVAPNVVFTPASGGPGSGAAATYYTGSASPWATLYETETDPVEGIVVNMEKKIVPAGTRHPGDGSYTDIKTIDKWRSIQIVSAVDITTLPKPYTYAKMYPLNLPDQLLTIEPIWYDSRGNSGTQAVNQEGSGSTNSISIENTTRGAIIVTKRKGFKGDVLAEVTRTYYPSAPLLENIPEPTIIQPVSGSVVIYSLHEELSASQGFGSNAQDESGGRKSTSLVDVVRIENVLTGNYYVVPDKRFGHTLSHQAVPVAAGAGEFSNIGLIYQVLTPTPAFMEIRMPDSEPSNLVPGDHMTIVGPLEKWKFGIFVQEIYRIVVPAINVSTE